MNYSELQDTIADWFARTDLPAATFISLAEDEMNRTLRLQGMEVLVTATPEYQTPDGLWYITNPEGFLEVKTIRAGDYLLECVSPHQIYENTETYYAMGNGTILLGDNDAVDLLYYKKVDPLSAQADENLFTTVASDALLYLALDHAASYMNMPGDYRQVATTRLNELVQANERANLVGPLVQRGM